MDISIFGLGYVGCVSLGCLSEYGHKIIGVDNDVKKVDRLNNGFPTIIEPELKNIIDRAVKYKRIIATEDAHYAVMNSEISIICVGTPLDEDSGKLNLDYVYNVASDISKAIEEKNTFHIIVLRSTVPPGTCDMIEEYIKNKSNKSIGIDFCLLSNPEFLREGSAIKDFNNPPYTLIGGSHMESINQLVRMYDSIDSEIVIVDRKIAEIMKYINNSFHALKVGFANEIGNICKALQLDSRQVMEIFCKDKKLNISPYYLSPGFSYGGSCLPKDLAALNAYSDEFRLNTPILKNIEKSNSFQIERAYEILVGTGQNSFGFLGLSFKAGTDDLRNSPIISLMAKLLRKGYDIQSFDDNISIDDLTGANKDYIDRTLPNFPKILSNNLDIVVNKSKVLVLGNKDPIFDNILINNKEKVFLDLAHNRHNTKNINNYIGINW